MSKNISDMNGDEFWAAFNQAADDFSLLTKGASILLDKLARDKSYMESEFDKVIININQTSTHAMLQAYQEIDGNFSLKLTREYSARIMFNKPYVEVLEICS